MYRSLPPARARLVALAVLLAGAFAGLPSLGGRAAVPAPAALFLSPNTDDGLSLEESLRRWTTVEHLYSRFLAVRILRELAAGPGKVHDAVGEWEGGVENSLLVLLPQAPDPVTLRCAAAWFGLAADQKAVLAFRPDAGGADVLATLTLPAPLAEVRRLLDAHEVRDRTILVEADGCRVFVLDGGGQRVRALAALARGANGRLSLQRGQGEAIAGATRDEARARYREVLRGSRHAPVASAGQ
jgi:hypothetical protein